MKKLMRKHGICVVGCLIAMMIAVVASAAPSLQITKPPVMGGDWAGPSIDTNAVNGQWFFDLTTHWETNRTHEFHDNVFPGHGGGFMSFAAISGVVVTIHYQAGPGTPILAFDISAQIFNDTPAEPPWMSGNNSHGEILDTTEQYHGPLYDAKLTAEFAIDSTNNLPTAFNGPYKTNDAIPYIIATNHDQLAWYCWAPEANYAITGSYFVPTWDFGTIEPGTFKTRLLSFRIDPPGLPSTDPRYNVIVYSEMEHNDILLNRTTSLKISTWIDTLAQDTGAPYPTPPARSSDCSVFHFIPEPCAFALLGLPLILCRRRR